MTQTAYSLHTVPTQPATERVRPSSLRPALSIHGEDPATGIPATWHVTPADDDEAPGSFVIERADGDIRNPHVWMQARRETRVGSESDVTELIRSVMVGR